MAKNNGNIAGAAGTIDVGGDLTVNRMGFGSMRILGPDIFGEPPSREDARATVRRAVELGVNFIDTADSYGPGISEEILCEALYPYPDGLVIGGKGGRLRNEPTPGDWPNDGRPEHLREVCEASLGRLRMQQFPLYQLHHPDDKVPIEDSVGALAELKDEGKILHIGLSNVNEEQIRRAQAVTPIVAIENFYTLDDRDDDSIIDLCEQEDMVYIPWATMSAPGPDPVVEDVARQHGASTRQVMLAWMLARSPALLAIPGTGSVSHVEENVKAAQVHLSHAEVDAIAAAH